MTFVYKFIKIRLANLLLLKYIFIIFTIIYTIHIINKLYIRLFKNLQNSVSSLYKYFYTFIHKNNIIYLNRVTYS